MFLLENTKRNKRNVSLLWIDYKKAYNSVPHSWIQKVIILYKGNPTITEFIKTTIPNWKININLPNKNGPIILNKINITTGIFQGDTFSLPLFYLKLAPLSNILKHANTGFKINDSVVSHLLYTDDLKVYAKNKEKMERCKELVQKISKDIKYTIIGTGRLIWIPRYNGSFRNTPHCNQRKTRKSLFHGWEKSSSQVWQQATWHTPSTDLHSPSWDTDLGF